MQAGKSNSVLHFLRNFILLEVAFLGAIALLWALTDWHKSTSYLSALIYASESVVGIGLLIALSRTGASNENAQLAQGEMEMRSWNREESRRTEPLFLEPARIAFMMLSIGIATIALVNFVLPLFR